MESEMKSKDDMECDCMNEEFAGGEELPRYHWLPVAEYDVDGNKIRDYTQEEQAEWIKKQLENGR